MTAGSHLNVPKFHPPMDSSVFSSLFLGCEREDWKAGSSHKQEATVVLVFLHSMEEQQEMGDGRQGQEREMAGERKEKEEHRIGEERKRGACN